MIRRIDPPIGAGEPCSICATKTAVFFKTGDTKDFVLPEGFSLKNDGYSTLDNTNKLVRENLSVRKREDYKRGERPILSKWIPKHPKEEALICCYGHFIYFDGEKYYSFFDNDKDEIVAVWYLK